MRFRQVLIYAEFTETMLHGWAKENKQSWSDLLSYLKQRGLKEIELVRSDKCLGLLERVMREIQRRTPMYIWVERCFPDVNSMLMLAAARLRNYLKTKFVILSPSLCSRTVSAKNLSLQASQPLRFAQSWS